jgi:hypothetical protein
MTGIRLAGDPSVNHYMQHGEFVMKNVNRKTLLAIAIAGITFSAQAQQRPETDPAAPAPGVAGDRTGQPGAQQRIPQQQQQPGNPQQGVSQRPPQSASAGISPQQAQAMVGKTIKSSSGEVIGEVDKIVRSASGEHFAVASRLLCTRR